MPAASGERPSSCAKTRPAAEPARRLSVEQYVNTLGDLFADDEALHPVLDAMQRSLAQLPRDGARGTSFSGMDSRVGPRHASVYVQVADDVARSVGSDPLRLRALAGGCALHAELDPACLSEFVLRFGGRIWRRPLDASESERLTSFARSAASGPESYQLALARLLSAPELLLRIERDGDAHSLASRLSLHFWQTSPDEALLEAAGRGELDDPGAYRGHVARLIRHQRGRATWYRFFRQWLELDAFGGFAMDAALARLAGRVDVSEQLYDDAVWEVERLVAHYTFEAPGSYAELLASDLNLNRSPRVAALYGVPMWDGVTAPGRFPEGERSGLLTRAALLFSANHATNPFERGAFVRRQLLCEPIEPPNERPPDAFVIPAFDRGSSTRERFERKVSSANCKGCHDLFTPYGYVLEAYDALGRFRRQERLIDDAGTEAGALAVNGRARVLLDPGVSLEVDSPVALSRALAESPMAERCLVRQYFRFTFQRLETRADACTLDEMQLGLDRGGLAGLLESVAFTSAFTRRSPAEAE